MIPSIIDIIVNILAASLYIAPVTIGSVWAHRDTLMIYREDKTRKPIQILGQRLYIYIPVFIVCSFLSIVILLVVQDYIFIDFDLSLETFISYFIRYFIGCIAGVTYLTLTHRFYRVWQDIILGYFLSLLIGAGSVPTLIELGIPTFILSWSEFAWQIALVLIIMRFVSRKKDIKEFVIYSSVMTISYTTIDTLIGFAIILIANIFNIPLR